MLRRIVMVAGVGLTLALGLLAAPAQAVVVYQWSGECTNGCTGTATGLLTLSDTYVPGTTVSASEFISFLYTSSSGSFTIPGSMTYNPTNSFENNSQNLVGPLPVGSGPGGIFVDAVESSSWFGTDFPFGAVDWQFLILGTVNDRGNPYQWSLVPIPAALPLFLSGLAVFGFVARKRRSAAAA